MKGNYVSIKRVAGMIARSHKHLAFDVYDMVEWCAEAIKNTGNFESFIHYTAHNNKECRIEVKNKCALLPCNVYRLLGVYHRGKPISTTRYVRNNDYLNFSDHHGFDFDHIEIDYLGIPVDDEGFPMVDEVMIQACYWYCLKMMLLEDFMNGKMDGQRYEYIDEQYGKYVAKARSSFKNVSHNDMNEVMMIMYNMIPKIRLPKNIG